GIGTFRARTGNGNGAAVETIKTLISKPEIGNTYLGKVRDIRDELGAFVEFLPKTDGLVHISEISKERVTKVSDHLKVGDRVKVKLVDIRKDPRTGKNRFALSIKAVESEPEKSDENKAGTEGN
ncbi:MAG: S1 RNA-binding domain-containing protein, partial [Chlorobiaceae bacterium]|nr:S1 RNA-binding domain-containing protein [Chlorobiaceae bacterium]